MWRDLEDYEKEYFKRIKSLFILANKVALVIEAIWLIIVSLLIYDELKDFPGERVQEGFWAIVALIILYIIYTAFMVRRKSNIDDIEIMRVTCTEKRENKRQKNGSTRKTFYFYFINEKGKEKVAFVKNEKLYNCVNVNDQFYVTRVKKIKLRKRLEGWPCDLRYAAEETITTDNIVNLIHEIFKK